MFPESLKYEDSLDYASGTASRNGASTDNSSFADLEGTGQTVANDDDNQNFITVIKRPGKRYLRPVVTKDGTNAAAEMVYMIKGGGGGPNLASVTDEITLESFVSPAEGTA